MKCLPKNTIISMFGLIIVVVLLDFVSSDQIQDDDSFHRDRIDELDSRFRCPEGWILNSDSSMCFRVFNATEAWPKSEEFCKGYGGNLASIHSEIDFILVKTLISDDTWIGLNDIKAEGVMEWSDSSAVDFTSWAPGEPNDVNGTENCVLLTKSANFDFTEDSCSEKKSFICEKVKLDAVPAYSCPQDWIMNSDISKCFQLISIPQSWEGSLDYCRAFGGDLASLHSESDFVLAKSLASVDTWIGLNDMDADGVMAWSDSSPVDFESWVPGQPDNKNESQSCVDLQSASNFDFNDDYCNLEESFLCERIPDIAHQCPEDWIPNSDSTKCYGKITAQHTWKITRNICRNFGGDLASLHSEADFELAKSLLSGTTWIGLNDRDSEGRMLWSDGSTVDYTRWASGEPNDGGKHGNEDCVEMKQSESYEFNDNDCDKYKMFLCETTLYAKKMQA